MPLRDVVAEVAVIIAYTVVAAVSHGIDAIKSRLRRA